MRANFVLSSVAAGLRRNLSMTLALVLSTSIALGFVGAGLLSNTEITKFRNQYESQINVSIYLCATEPQPPCKAKTTDAQTAAIRAALDSDPLVRSEQYVSEQQAFDRGQALQDPSVAKFLKPGVLPASFTVKLKDLQKNYNAFQAKYSKFAGVGQVLNAFDTINTLLNMINSVRKLSLIVALVALVASILLIGNTVQMAAAQRRNETSIMRLVGASRWMTELPFVLETLIATLIGGIVALASIWVGKSYILNSVFRGPTSRGVIPNLTADDIIKAGGIALLTGLVLSAVTAFGTLRLRVRL
ncbi:MAG: cell division transport system permease protein [Pseudonocardiales bacterium]|nr:cell division transport system permease protein [Pseudonocardiales bacterium]